MEKSDIQSPETARVDHCMKCGSTSMKNNVYFCKGQNVRVYLECAQCGSYVARYTLLGYTSDEPYESLLQKMRFTRVDSGRKALSMVETFGEDVHLEFRHVLDLVNTREDERRMEQIIEEDFPESLG